jgi:uncharacterized protein YaiL (DUF2058 family)
MGSSLQEQLLKAGLVNKTKVQQAKKQTRKKKQSKAAVAEDSTARLVARAQEEKAAKDRELNRAMEAKKAARARKLLLKQHVEKCMLNAPKAEDAYNFVHGGSVKRLYVTQKQREQLGAGQLAIVGVAERYYLIDAEESLKIQAMAPDTFVYKALDEKPDEDDPYADFQVPDDLMW